MTTKELGDLGEKLACEYLVGKGFNILGKNHRISFGGQKPAPTFGEIDIIARKKSKFFARTVESIHFIEVKTIMQNSGPALSQAEGFFPEQHVNYKKQRKLKNLAQIWLSKHKFGPDTPYQIDIIGILVNETTRNAKLHYFPNALSGK